MKSVPNTYLSDRHLNLGNGFLSDQSEMLCIHVDAIFEPKAVQGTIFVIQSRGQKTTSTRFPKSARTSNVAIGCQTHCTIQVNL